MSNLLSIIVVNHNTRDVLRNCLDSILKNAPAAPHTITVVDNCSSDGSAEMVEKEFPSVKVQKLPENVGFSRANNYAIKTCSSPYLLLLNSDTLVFPKTIDRLLNFAKNHDEAGIIGCRQLDSERRLKHSWGKFPTLPRELIRKIIHHRLELNGTVIRDYLDSKYNDASEIDWVSGSCMMVKHEALCEIGLLDERFFLYFEDIDWCERMQRAGWKVYYYPGAEIIHFGGISANKNKEKALVAYRESQLYFSKKYFRRFTHIILKSLLFIKTLINLLKLQFLKFMGRRNFREEKINLLLRAHRRILSLLVSDYPELGED